MTLTVNAETLLRNYTEEDAAALFAAVNENRAHLRRWLAWVDGTQKEAHSLEFIRTARQEQYDQRSIVFGIFKKDRLVGGISMHDWDQHLKKAQLGYWIAKAEEGKGLLSECARVLVAYLFDQLQLNKIELHYLAANVRSGAVAQRLGFKVEGVLRDSFLFNGAFHDMVISGLLRREYERK